MGGISPPSPKFQPRGQVLDLNDTTLADGYYLVANDAANQPDGGIGSLAQYFGVYSKKTSKPVGNSTKYKTMEETVTYNVNGMAGQVETRTWKRIRCWASNYGWYAGAWRGEFTPWSGCTMQNFWLDTGDYCNFRINGGNVDVQIHAKTNATTGNLTYIASMPTLVYPEETKYFPAILETGSGKYPTRVKVSGGTPQIHLDETTIGLSHQVTASFSFRTQY